MGAGSAGRQLLTGSRCTVGFVSEPLALDLLPVRFIFCLVFLIAIFWDELKKEEVFLGLRVSKKDKKKKTRKNVSATVADARSGTRVKNAIRWIESKNPEPKKITLGSHEIAYRRRSLGNSCNTKIAKHAHFNTCKFKAERQIQIALHRTIEAILGQVEECKSEIPLFRGSLHDVSI